MSEWQPIETMPEDNADDVDARFLQAAQSVAVVGEPVAWVNINKHGDITRTVSRRDNWCTTPVYRKPTNSIPAADLARLREKATELSTLREKATEQAGAYEQRLRNLEASMTAAVAGCQKRIADMKENERLTDEIRMKMGRILDGAAVVLKGQPDEPSMHSWHDLPELCEQLIRELATLREKAAEADELRKDAEKRDAREDRHWRAGFMDGWNAGVIGDESALKAAGERLYAAIAQGQTK